MTNRHWQIHTTLPSLIALMELIFICVPLITWKLHTFYAWHILHSFSERLWREQGKKSIYQFVSPFTAAIDHLPSNQSCFMGPLFSTIVVTKWQQKGTVHKKNMVEIFRCFFSPLNRWDLECPCFPVMVLRCFLCSSLPLLPGCQAFHHSKKDRAPEYPDTPLISHGNYFTFIEDI